ncbi:MAG: TolC family protein [Fibromonadaceae bacterium]|jgi:outer membrane protein TolC|nr:TolC family protein [Fibromonadaceae bacterium]
MRKILCFLTFAACFAVAVGAPLSLKQALDEGLKGNLDIQSSELGFQGMDAQIDEAFRRYLPQITANGRVTHLFLNDPIRIPDLPGPIAAMMGIPITEVSLNWAVTGDITLNQFLYVPQALTGIKMAKKGKEISALGRQELKEGIVYGITIQYWTTVYMEENLDVLEKSKANLSRTREVIAAMVEQGIVKKSDLNTIDINLASLNTQIDNLKVQIQTQKDALLQVMGRTPGEQIALTDRLDPDSRLSEEISGDPLQSSITLRRMEQQIKLQDMRIDLTRQEIYPNVVAFASYGTKSGGEKISDIKDNFKDDGGVVGINVTVPLFDGMSNKAKRSNARIQKKQLEIDMEKQRLALQATYETAKSTLFNAKNLVLRNKENVKLAEENYVMKELEYQEQVAPVTDLLTADNSMQTARSNLISALYSEKTAELALEQVLGILRQRAGD